jgi:outer membrane immunogenic protein
MKRIVTFAIAAAAASASTLAVAADIPGRRAAPAPAPAYVPPPLFTWTGFYVGLNAGYTFANRGRASYNGNAAYLALGGAVPQSYNIRRNGFIGGAQAGYNIQSGAFVYGIEGDIDFATGRKTRTVVAPFATGSARSELNWLGTVRGRVGFLVTDRWLAYATGGLAVGETKLRNRLVGNAGTPLVGDVWSGSNSRTRAGWTLGAGTEYAITNNLTAKLEYLYYDLGRQTVTVAPANAAATATGLVPRLRERNNGSLVRAGLNWKF